MDIEKEYRETIKKYKELEALVSQRIAGTIEKQKCPDELLKSQLTVLGTYLRILEQRLKYEN